MLLLLFLLLLSFCFFCSLFLLILKLGLRNKLITTSQFSSEILFTDIVSIMYIQYMWYCLYLFIFAFYEGTELFPINGPRKILDC